MDPLSPNASSGAAGGGPVASGRFAVVDPWRVVRQYAWLLIGAAVLGALLGGGSWFLLTRYWPRYTSEAQLTVTGGISDPYQLVQEGAGLRQTGMDLIDTFIMNQIIRLSSDEVLEGALRRDNVRETSWYASFGNDTGEARESLKRHLDARKLRNSTLVYVSFTTSNQEDPPVILDAVLDVYIKKLGVESERESDDVRRAMVRERDRAEEYQRQIEDQMKQFTIQNDLSAIMSRSHEATVAYKVLSEQKTQLELAMRAAREAYPALVNAQRAGGGTYSPEQLAQADADPTVAVRNERLLNLRTQREVLLERFGEHHRVVREIDLQIVATEQEKKRQIERFMRQMEQVQLEQAKKLVDSLTAQLEGLRPSFEATRAQLRDLGLKLEEFKRLEVQAQVAAERRARAESALTSMRIQTDRPDSTQVRVVFTAMEAKLSFPPGLKLMVSGSTLFVVAIVAGFAFLKEMLDQRIKSPADVVRLPGCELLGVIPELAEDPSNPAHMEGVVRLNPTGLMAEAFRQVRTSLLTRMESNHHTTLLLVGAQPDSGTSAVANNLSMSLAYDGKKVLLLDANYRRPSQHKLFGLTIEPGLIELLAGSATIDEAVSRIDAPPMDVLPVGHAADALPEMFESATFRHLLEQLKNRYDIILIDVPPALLTSDSVLMSKHVDGVAVVVRAMQDMRGMIQRVLRELSGQRATILGVILNGARTSAGGYFRKNYRAFYRYGRLDPFARSESDDALVVDTFSDQ